MKLLKNLFGGGDKKQSFDTRHPSWPLDAHDAAEQLEVGETLTFSNGTTEYTVQRMPDDQTLQRYTIKDASGRVLYDCPGVMLFNSLRDFR